MLDYKYKITQTGFETLQMRHVRNVNRSIATILAIFIAQDALAATADEEDLFSLSLEELLNTEVFIASNIVTDARKQPVSISQLGKDTIALSGARTLNELLSIYVPGYFMVEDQDDTIAGFRGLAPDNNSKVMVLLNGENLNAEWFWGAPDALLNGIDLDFIERIEIIRGPGSVTLGQGALLGVINIITQHAESNEWRVSMSAGAEQLRKASITAQYIKEDTSTWLYTSYGSYSGAPMPNLGWAKARTDQGLTVYQRNHHLHRSEFANFISNLKFKDVQFSAFQFKQRRDLYNFFRDREVVEQRLRGVTLKYQHELDSGLRFTLSSRYAQDDYALYSHGDNYPASSRLNFETELSVFSEFFNAINGYADERVEAGLTMGGTRETRKGLKLIINYDWNTEHKLAFGAEVSHFDMGQKNYQGNNFIINEEIQRLGLGSVVSGNNGLSGTVNDNNLWVKPYSFTMTSLFLEELWDINDSIDIFAALRWDDHPNWGSQVSPRLGAVLTYDESHSFRVSLQSGFRGAVGVQFAGGFVQDGLLAQENFEHANNISNTNVDVNFNGNPEDDEINLSRVEPETITSFELAYDYSAKNLNVDAALFYNHIHDILAAQAHGYVGLGFGDRIGSDEIGTWNGNWYYQNQSGELNQIGFELDMSYRFDNWLFQASHSHVQVVSADEDALGVYVLEGEKTAAYPENISRAQINYKTQFSSGEINAHINEVIFWQYIAPNGEEVDGTHIVNLGLSWTPATFQNLTAELIIKNVTDTNELYPINGTGITAEATGTPVIEGRTWWLNFKFKI